ncbi:hypothetical protein P152DRAFT_514376 [Eremomyces bilateralis CBS 781.70]|uniref:DNA mismatch repair protein S5 domain-containing protein n=1 Tax=Eremomyces bilateralis CBS 781.70 TaxID=1392243 RepID=A0A6G1G2R3_9PEZI|nr:uncharacterized protein P152DRAFT_514376 [Eremomyces bilateralis CBS 781.70]KAF1812210.1 hypothetical protein P152DRAFT_514376 [Eremomyces bilateralis CBS 781.70]
MSVTLLPPPSPQAPRALRSTQTITTTPSALKELLDNALDARASSIALDLAADSLSSLSVRDNGHGIIPEDRRLVCRRHCTSKLRDLDELSEVGRKSLGFRGETLASVAEVSRGVRVSSKVEGESVGQCFWYGPDGEPTRHSPTPQPVGTTVHVEGFLEQFPVQKQAALKTVSKTHATIKALLKMYALARPGVRLSLCVLETPDGSWSYSPAAEPTVQDAAMKLFGTAPVAMCAWETFHHDRYEFQALLPSPTATDPQAVDRLGSFLSIDARPVSSTRWPQKQLISLFRETLKRQCPQFAGAKDPLLVLNVVCEAGIYNPNVKPAKDDTHFDGAAEVLGAFQKFMVQVYGEDAAQPSSATDVEATVSSSPLPSISGEAPARNIGLADVGSPSTAFPMTPSSAFRTYHHTQEIRNNVDGDTQREGSNSALSQNPDATELNPWTLSRLNARTGLIDSLALQMTTSRQHLNLVNRSAVQLPSPKNFQTVHNQMPPSPRASSPVRIASPYPSYSLPIKDHQSSSSPSSRRVLCTYGSVRSARGRGGFSNFVSARKMRGYDRGSNSTPTQSVMGRPPPRSMGRWGIPSRSEPDGSTYPLRKRQRQTPRTTADLRTAFQPLQHVAHPPATVFSTHSHGPVATSEQIQHPSPYRPFSQPSFAGSNRPIPSASSVELMSKHEQIPSQQRPILSGTIATDKPSGLHNLQLAISASLDCIRTSLRKLNIITNRIQWGWPARESYYALQPPPGGMELQRMNARLHRLLAEKYPDINLDGNLQIDLKVAFSSGDEVLLQ